MPEENYSDLIDVSDIAPVLDDERMEIEMPSSAPPSAGDFSIASLSERFSAFFTDLVILYIFYAISILIYCYTFIEVPPFIIPFKTTQGLIFHGIILSIFILYFLVSEMFFEGTIGKKICHLSIRRTDGRPLGKLSALIRTILRPIDIILLPINLFIIEKTSWNQKIGDLLSATVVIKYLSQRRKSYNPSSNNLASATGRLLAFIIDLALLVSFAGGFIMLLNNDQPILSLFIVLFLPVFILFGVSFTEAVFGTTPGKWIFGYLICKEDGTKTTWAQSIIRTIFRIYDNNPIGFLCVYLGNGKQRPGDMSAGTLVIKQRREIKGLMCIVLVAGISLLMGYIGLQNRDSIILEKIYPNFLIKYSMRGRMLRVSAEKRLTVTDLKFASGSPTAFKDEALFNAGDKIFITFLVDGYNLSGNTPWISQDLTIKYPNGSTAIQLENLVEFRSELKTTGPIMIPNNFELPINSPAGKYTLVLTVNDKLKNNTLKRHFFFYVKSATKTEGESQPALPPSTESKPETIQNEPKNISPEPENVRPYGSEDDSDDTILLERSSDRPIEEESEENIDSNFSDEDETSGM